MKVRKAVPREQFNYPLFRMDVNRKCKEARVSLVELSEKKFFRSGNYLSASLDAQRLPLNIILALCDYLDLSAKEYEIRPVAEKPKAEPPKPAIPTVCDSLPLVFNVVCGGELYTCETRVSSDMGAVSSTLTHDGKIVDRGSGFYHNDSVASMLCGISYGIYALAQEIKKKE